MGTSLRLTCVDDLVAAGGGVECLSMQICELLFVFSQLVDDLEPTAVNFELASIC
jgi:hypothetical protein